MAPNPVRYVTKCDLCGRHHGTLERCPPTEAEVTEELLQIIDGILRPIDPFPPTAQTDAPERAE